jgi:thiol-disulfide isomerase/thioredoxin
VNEGSFIHVAFSLRSRCVRVAFAAVALLGLRAVAGAQPRLAGELDAKGYAARVAAEKGRVVLVNFWATWCVPCREEFPDLVRLQKAYGEKGLTVIGISTDFAKQLPAVETFLAKQRPSFPNYHKAAGGEDQVFIEAVDEKWGGELPFSVLFDRDGRKVRTLPGKNAYAAYEKEVTKLLR